MAIPKIIHQTYKSHDLPAPIRIVIDELKYKNPNWAYRFYTDDDIFDYIKTHFDEYTLNAYQKINPVYGAARADLFRYLVLYREGGLYLDIKSTCVYPLDEIIKDDDVFISAHWQNDIGQIWENAGIYQSLIKLGMQYGEYQQWFILCEKNSPIMKHIINEIINNILSYRAWHYGFRSYGKRGVLFVTGPVAYSKAIWQLNYKYPMRIARYDKDLGFVYNALQQSHENILPHYSKFKQPIVNQGYFLNTLFIVYIFFIRIFKEILVITGFWKN